MYTLEGSAFKNLWLLIICENCNQIMDIIARLYYKHIQFNIPKTENSYQKTNLTVLWFLNTTGCWCQIVLACLIYKIAFNDRIDCEYYYDNYIYNRGKARQVPVFEAYNVIAKLGIIYTDIAKYSDLLLSSKRQRSLARNLPKSPKKKIQTNLCIWRDFKQLCATNLVK